jgi:hypothetical protein
MGRDEGAILNSSQWQRAQKVRLEPAELIFAFRIHCVEMSGLASCIAVFTLKLLVLSHLSSKDSNC